MKLPPKKNMEEIKPMQNFILIILITFMMHCNRNLIVTTPKTKKPVLVGNVLEVKGKRVNLTKKELISTKENTGFLLFAIFPFAMTSRYGWSSIDRFDDSIASDFTNEKYIKVNNYFFKTFNFHVIGGFISYGGVDIDGGIEIEK